MSFGFDPAALDRHITGNWGEDQFQSDADPHEPGLGGEFDDFATQPEVATGQEVCSECHMYGQHKMDCSQGKAAANAKEVTLGGPYHSYSRKINLMLELEITFSVPSERSKEEQAQVERLALSNRILRAKGAIEERLPGWTVTDESVV
jgi:hypothetical protein